MESVPPSLQHVYIEADPHKLSQVVRNLVSNALKFTPAEGTVTVKISSRLRSATREDNSVGGSAGEGRRRSVSSFVLGRAMESSSATVTPDLGLGAVDARGERRNSDLDRNSIYRHDVFRLDVIDTGPGISQVRPYSGCEC